MVDIYNPFSLINALDTQDLNSYWASSGATSMLPKFIKDAELRPPCSLPRTARWAMRSSTMPLIMESTVTATPTILI